MSVATRPGVMRCPETSESTAGMFARAREPAGERQAVKEHVQQRDLGVGEVQDRVLADTAWLGGYQAGAQRAAGRVIGGVSAGDRLRCCVITLRMFHNEITDVKCQPRLSELRRC